MPIRANNAAARAGSSGVIDRAGVVLAVADPLWLSSMNPAIAWSRCASDTPQPASKPRGFGLAVAVQISAMHGGEFHPPAQGAQIAFDALIPHQHVELFHANRPVIRRKVIFQQAQGLPGHDKGPHQPPRFGHGEKHLPQAPLRESKDGIGKAQGVAVHEHTWRIRKGAVDGLGDQGRFRPWFDHNGLRVAMLGRAAGPQRGGPDQVNSVRVSQGFAPNGDVAEEIGL